MELELTSNLYQIVKWKAILGQCWPHKSSVHIFTIFPQFMDYAVCGA